MPLPSHLGLPMNISKHMVYGYKQEAKTKHYNNWENFTSQRDLLDNVDVTQFNRFDQSWVLIS